METARRMPENKIEWFYLIAFDRGVSNYIIRRSFTHIGDYSVKSRNLSLHGLLYK